MLELGDPGTFWVSFVNVALGLLTLSCAALIVSAVINELVDREAARWTERRDWIGRAFHASRPRATSDNDSGRTGDEAEASGPAAYGF
jgi:hypothetical protein